MLSMNGSAAVLLDARVEPLSASPGTEGRRPKVAETFSCRGATGHALRARRGVARPHT